MGCKQVGIKKHLTEHAEEHRKIKSKVTGIPEGNLVILCNHLEGHNKIKDKYKSEEFVVVGKHPEPNMHLLSHSMAVGLCGQSLDANSKILGKTKNDGGLTSPQENHDGSQVPSFNL